jgi:branched-subunit amino acid transport protein
VSVLAALAVVLVVGVMTYAMRAIAIVTLAGRTIPVPLERALRNVGPAVLAALAINLAAGGESGGPSLSFAEAVALVVAGGVAWWKKNVIATVVAGMATLWLLSAFT